MKQALIYSLKVWLTSDLIGPLITVCCLVIQTSHVDMDLFGFILAMMLFGLIYSIPSFLLLLLISWVLSRFNLSSATKKIIISCLSIPPIVLLIKKLFPVANDPLLAITYSAVALACIWFYKLDTPNTDIAKA